jgi:drug/metabolite transporter (DMT)-like permease
MTAVGVGLGFAGVAILLLPGSRPAGATLGGLALCVLAAMLWATGSFSSRRLPLPRDPLVSTAVQMTFGGAFMLVAGSAVGEIGDVDLGAVSTKSAIAFVYLVTIGSVVAYSAYVWLLQNAPISQVATYAYVNPVVAVLLGWSILSEEISATTLVGAAVIVTAVVIVVRRESQGEPEAEAAAERTPSPREPVEVAQ